MKLGTIISRHARYRPNHYGVIFENHQLTWREFDKRVNRLSNGLLDLGMSKGEKVATLLPNSIELIDTYWMAAKIGIVIVPLNPLLRGKGLTTLLNDSDSVCVITTKAMVKELEAVRDDLPNVRHWILIDADVVPTYLDYQAIVGTASADVAPGFVIRDVVLWGGRWGGGGGGVGGGVGRGLR
jgi:acyl-CoA synthetase (AMP-forming)/AMP-acid ligase II